MNKYYFSVLIQDEESINEIDNIREKCEENENFNVCQYVAGLYADWCDDINNFTDYEPYICRGSDFVVDTYGEFTLLRNMGIFGAYMLYRAAYKDEQEWINYMK